MRAHLEDETLDGGCRGVSLGPAFDPNETDEQVRAREEELKKARKTTQRAVEIVLIPGVPLLMALVGVLRWQSRKKARANVSLA